MSARALAAIELVPAKPIPFMPGARQWFLPRQTLAPGEVRLLWTIPVQLEPDSMCAGFGWGGVFVGGQASAAFLQLAGGLMRVGSALPVLFGGSGTQYILGAGPGTFPNVTLAVNAQGEVEITGDNSLGPDPISLELSWSLGYAQSALPL